MELKDLKFWINEKYLGSCERGTLREDYLVSDPFEHFVLDEFLTAQAFAKFQKAMSSVYKIDNVSREGLSRDRKINWGLICDKEVLHFIFSSQLALFVSNLAGESAKLKEGILPQITEFLPGTKGYDVHNDFGELFDFVFLLYLQNEGFSRPHHAAYCLHEKVDVEPIKIVEARPNRAIFFRVSELSYHSVNDLGPNQQRSSLNLDWVLPDSKRAIARAMLALPQCER
jgi:hypothetical protein